MSFALTESTFFFIRYFQCLAMMGKFIIKQENLRSNAFQQPKTSKVLAKCLQ